VPSASWIFSLAASFSSAASFTSALSFFSASGQDDDVCRPALQQYELAPLCESQIVANHEK
jgi:hypothetical protein